MVQAVPSAAVFKCVLKLVRFWAKRRGIYSVNCGYFSGITLSVMVARVCQDFPELQPPCMLHKFFTRYADSDWRDPVQLQMKTKGRNLIASHLSALDRISNDVMVVLVPIDEIKNTSYRVSDHTFQTICTELQRAKLILQKLAPASAIKHKRNKIDLCTDMDSLIDKLLAEEELKEDLTCWTLLFK